MNLSNNNAVMMSTEDVYSNNNNNNDFNDSPMMNASECLSWTCAGPGSGAMSTSFCQPPAATAVPPPPPSRSSYGQEAASGAAAASASASASAASPSPSPNTLFHRPTPLPGQGYHDNVSGTDALSAKEMLQLSMEERDQIYDEIHAVSSPSLVPENEPQINQALAQMEFEIKKIRSRACYKRAIFLNSQYVTNRKFRIMFLRSTSSISTTTTTNTNTTTTMKNGDQVVVPNKQIIYNPRSAAQMIVKHFEYKAMLFGNDKLVQTITIYDLLQNPEDLKVLKSGDFQFLSKPDPSGRPIIFASRKYILGTINWKSEVRVLWYRIMVELEQQTNNTTNSSEIMQRKGIVMIGYAIDLNPIKELKIHNSIIEFVRQSYIFRDGLPTRMSTIHHCTNNKITKTAISICQSIMGTNFRLRFRSHFGSHMECRYLLETFGISRNIIPLDDNNEMNYEWNENYIQRRSEIETAAKQQAQQLNLLTMIDSNNNISCHPPPAQSHPHPMIIIQPTENDVLLGRGYQSQYHAGNIVLKQMTEQLLTRYKEADKFEKTCISWDVIQTIQTQKGGRFLEYNIEFGTWQIVNDDIAREKVSHGFRMKKTKNKNNKNTKNTNKRKIG